MPITVLLADDQPLIRTGIAMILAAESDIEVVAEAADGSEAIALSRRLLPDVVVMDVRMPGTGGVEATAEITGRAAAGTVPGRAKVLILTTYHVDDAVYAALRAGASGFLLKDAVPQDLVSAIRVVAGGQAWLAPAVASTLIADVAARPVTTDRIPARLDALTSREVEVLVLMAQGLSNHEIAERLVVGDATVKTHVGRVLMKLNMRDRTQAVVVAYQSGLVQPGIIASAPTT